MRLNHQNKNTPGELSIVVAAIMGMLCFIYKEKADVVFDHYSQLIKRNQLETGLLVVWIFGIIAHVFNIKRKLEKKCKEFLAGPKEKYKHFKTPENLFAFTLCVSAFPLVIVPAYWDFFISIAERLPLIMSERQIQNIFILVFYFTCVLGFQYALWIKPENSGVIQRPENKKKIKEPKIKANRIDLGVIGEDNTIFDDKDVKSPKWLQIGPKGLKGNIAVFGSIGSSKTSSVVIPIMRQIPNRFKNYLIFVFDPKRSITNDFKRNGIPGYENAIVIDEHSDYSFNPFDRKDLMRDANYDVIAQQMALTATVLGANSSGSDIWIQSARSYFVALIGFTYLIKGEKFTFQDMKDVRELIKLEGAEVFLEEAREKIDSSNYPEDIKHNLHQCRSKLVDHATSGKDLQSSVELTANVFLDMLSDYTYGKLFNRKSANTKTIKDLIQNKTKVFVAIKSDSHAVGIITMLKQQLFQAVKEAYLSGEIPKDMLTFSIEDEFQKHVTILDTEQTAEAREFGWVRIMATPSFSQIHSSLKNEDAADSLLENFRTKILFGTTCSKTVGYAVKNFGSESILRTNQGISESDLEHGASRTSRSESTSEAEKRLLEEGKISTLKTFEAYSMVFDGTSNERYKLFTKPYFLPRNMPHKKIIQLTKEIK